MTKLQFSISIGMGIRTMQRRLKEMNYKTKAGLLSPEEQAEILKVLREWELKYHRNSM
jgi:hypothetical protein